MFGEWSVKKMQKDMNAWLKEISLEALILVLETKLPQVFFKNILIIYNQINILAIN
jgi:hypothetical protein